MKLISKGSHAKPHEYSCSVPFSKQLRNSFSIWTPRFNAKTKQHTEKLKRT